MSDLSINRDISENLLIQAQKALRDDGQISKTEYESLKKEALKDGKVTDKEILFISSLDDVNVITQLKTASATAIISIIDEKDHKLEVDGDTINVQKSLRIEEMLNEPVKKDNYEKEASYNDLNKTYFHTIRTMDTMKQNLKNYFPVDEFVNNEINKPNFFNPGVNPVEYEKKSKSAELFLNQFGKNFLNTANNLVNISPDLKLESFRKDFVVSGFNALKEFEKINLSPSIGGPPTVVSLKKPEPIAESHYSPEQNKFRNDMDLKDYVFDAKKFKGLGGRDVMRLKLLEVFASAPSEIVDYYSNSKVDPDGNDIFFDLMKNLVSPNEPEADKVIQKYISRIILNLAAPIKNIGPEEKTPDTENKIIKQAQMLGYFLGATEAAYESKYKNEKDAEEAKKALVKAVIDEAISLIPMGDMVGKTVEKIVDTADKAVKAKIEKEAESKLKGSIKDVAYKTVDSVINGNIKEKYEDMKGSVKSMKDFYREYLNINNNSWINVFIEQKYTTTYVNNNKIKE